jgi:hypothetical protein
VEIGAGEAALGGGAAGLAEVVAEPAPAEAGGFEVALGPLAGEMPGEGAVPAPAAALPAAAAAPAVGDSAAKSAYLPRSANTFLKQGLQYKTPEIIATATSVTRLLHLLHLKHSCQSKSAKPVSHVKQPSPQSSKPQQCPDLVVNGVVVLQLLCRICKTREKRARLNLKSEQGLEGNACARI